MVSVSGFIVIALTRPSRALESPGCKPMREAACGVTLALLLVRNAIEDERWNR
jgi:hypothetical protein